MKRDKGERDGREPTETTKPTTLERLQELTRNVLAVPKSEIDELAERTKKSAKSGGG